MDYSKNTPGHQQNLTNPIICYPGSFAMTSKISKTGRNILDILLGLMDTENMIYIDSGTLGNIQRFSKHLHGKEYAVQTIRNVIHELVKNELLFKAYKKNYLINPVYFVIFSPSDTRKRLITNCIKMNLLQIDQ